MTRRERLEATLHGRSVDRPPVCFYELNGMDESPSETDPFNIYSHPSWRPLLDLARERTDRIVLRGVAFRDLLPDPLEQLATQETDVRDGSLYVRRRIQAGGRVLTSLTRRDLDVNTVWTVEHLLKDTDDLRAFLDLPAPEFEGRPDPSWVLDTEAALGDTGMVMLDTPDPLCLAASLFDMATYTVIALTEIALFRRLLDRFAALLLPRTRAVAEALPGRLWRIYGPEYASPPYLPPRLFREYVCGYAKPMSEAIRRTGGLVRLHSHGNLMAILDDMVSIGIDGLDPIEPPPQGDVELGYVRKRYGKDLVLFGNLEVSDIELLPTDQFAEKVSRALDEGTAGPGRGFVLMPSASPYGRQLAPLTLRNYERMVELVEAL
jgi:hypothetical protein